MHICSTPHHRGGTVGFTKLVPAILAAGALLAFCSPARANLVTFAFTGEVDFVMDQSNLLGGSVAIGTPISGSYTFDSTTPDALAAEPQFGYYPQAIESVSGSLGPIPFVGPTGTQNEIGVSVRSLDNIYSAIVGTTVNSHLIQFSLSLADDGNTLFGTDALPLVPPDLETLESRSIGFVAEDIGLNVHAQLTSLVLPEPSVAPVVCLVSAFFLRKRHAPSHQ